MKQVYMADDGKVFQTEDECIIYETNKDINQKLTSLVYSSASIVSGATILDFILKNKDDLLNILSRESESVEWISNEDNPNDYPPIETNTFIEVRNRDGSTLKGLAKHWWSSWRSRDNHPRDIVEYRILKVSE